MIPSNLKRPSAAVSACVVVAPNVALTDTPGRTAFVPESITTPVTDALLPFGGLVLVGKRTGEKLTVAFATTFVAADTESKPESVAETWVRPALRPVMR